jgi:hypothetical protein
MTRLSVPLSISKEDKDLFINSCDHSGIKYLIKDEDKLSFVFMVQVFDFELFYLGRRMEALRKSKSK